MDTLTRLASRLVLARELLWSGTDDRVLRRAAEHGRVVRVISGVYLDATVWNTLEEDERYLLRIAAVAGTRRASVVYSHYSAAALLGYPVIGRWPTQVHLIVGAGSGQRSSPAVVRHVMSVREDELVEVGGFLMTNPLRTVCDIARVASTATALATLDRALAPVGTSNRDSEPLERVFGAASAVRQEPPLEREEILDALGRLGPVRGIRQARFVATFADGASGSPGESLSRLQIHRLHLPKPDLQVRVSNGLVRYWEVDFGWETERLLGEFDGFGKYHRSKMTKGASPEQVVWAEKKREDAIRASTKRGMVRWPWEVAHNLSALRQLLVEAGLRPQRGHG
ncbi:MAG: hypothetical protein ABI275_00455 [Terrimesophilobacter sp.]